MIQSQCHHAAEACGSFDLAEHGCDKWRNFYSHSAVAIEQVLQLPES